jgi:adenine-specific DNA-methyltransferase
LFYEFPIDSEGINNDWDEDEIGFYKKGAPMRATGTEDKREDRAEMFYPFLIKDEIVTTIPEDELAEVDIIYIKIYKNI